MYPPLRPNNCWGMVTVLIRRLIQSPVESSPELLHAVAASASVWGAGSLGFLELTPASPVSTCSRCPPSLRPAVLLNPRVYFTGPSSVTISELTRILLLHRRNGPPFEWTPPHSAWETHSASPRVT